MSLYYLYYKIILYIIIEINFLKFNKLSNFIKNIEYNEIL